MTIELQEKFIKELINSFDESWESIHMHYENMMIDNFRNVIYSAWYFSDGIEYEFDPELETLEILKELNQNQPEEQSEKWTWLEFSIENSGQCKFEYKYGIPPHLATELKYSKMVED